MQMFPSAAIGRIHGVWCIVSANEGTLKGGTYFPIGVQKSRLATEMAHRLRLPLVLLIDSGGAFLPLQVSFYRHTSVRKFFFSLKKFTWNLMNLDSDYKWNELNLDLITLLLLQKMNSLSNLKIIRKKVLKLEEKKRYIDYHQKKA